MKAACTLVLSATIAMTASLASADGHGGNPAVKARQAHMQLYGFNLGILGAMAKGETEYNADAAMAAANNLATVSALNQSAYWAEGTDNEALGDETKALPALWGADSNAAEIASDLVIAAASLAEVAGDGQEAIGPALGPVGQACGACHKAYRAK